MNEPEPSNHWDSLAEDLGATPSPPPEPGDTPNDGSAAGESDESISPPGDTPDDQAGPSSEELQPPPPARKKPAVRRRPKPAPADWSSLAGDLGLPPAPEPAPDSTPDTVEADGSEDVSDRGEQEVFVMSAFQVEEGAGDEAPPTADAIEPTDDIEQSQSARRAASLEFGFGVIEVDDTRDQTFIEEAEDAVADEDDDENDDDDDDTDTDDDTDDENDDENDDEDEDDDAEATIAGLFSEPATVDKPAILEELATLESPDELDFIAETFGVPDAVDQVDDAEESSEEAETLAEAETSATEGKSRRRRRRRGRKKRPDAETGEGAESDTQHDLDLDDKSIAADESLDEEGLAVAEGDEAKDEGREKVRRRRRRRRPKRSTPDENVGQEPAEGDESEAATSDVDEGEDWDEDDEAAPASDEKKPSRGRRRGKQETEDEEEGESARPSHRKIPSWSEGVGFVISANMESRSRSPDSGGRPRGRGKRRPGGRGRKSP